HGNYEYYLWKKAQELESLGESAEELTGKPRKTAVEPTRALAQQSPAAPTSEGSTRRALTKTQARLEKQVARLEAEIAHLEEKVNAREAELANPDLYHDFGKWNLLHQEQEGWKRDLDRLTARWESLSAELEDVKHKLTAWS
ncbi:MAG: hypothetical protein ACK4VP_07235, partial [Nitrospira sp.]